MSPRIALLIDAENISYKDLPRILKKVSPLGEVIVKAVYGNWDSPHLQNWREVAEQNDCNLRHQPNPSKIKNASDMKLIIDAMDIIRYVEVNTFCLVTNDADFIPLCEKINESKKIIIGLGYKNAAEALMRACDQFIFIKRKTPEQPAPPVQVEAPAISPKPAVQQQPASAKATPLPNLKKLLKKAFTHASSQENEWIALSPLGTAIRQIYADFDPNAYDQPTLSKLLDSVPNIVELKGSGNDMCARLKPTPTPKKSTPQKNLEELLSKAFDAAAYDTEGWVTLGLLGHIIRQLDTGFQSDHYGHSTLSKLLQTMPDLVELHENGNGKSARLIK